MTRRWHAAWLVIALAATAAACRADSEGEVWRFAIEETQGSVQHAYAMEFAKRIEEKSGGEIDVLVYPYGTIGTSDEITELLHNDSIQFVMASPGHLGKLIPEVQVFLLHFVFSGDEEVNNLALADEELRASLDELYRNKGFRALAFFTEGWQVWTTNKPVREPSDFRGIKIRVMTSPMLLAAYKAYGASPTPLPYSEVYSALQLNMIDAQANPVFAIQEMSFHEVTDYMIFPRHAQFVTSAMTNENFARELSEERWAMIEETIDELQPWIFDVQRQFNQERLETILEDNPAIETIRLSDEEREAFRKASLPVRETFVRQVGESGGRVLDQLLEAVKAAKAELATQSS